MKWNNPLSNETLNDMFAIRIICLCLLLTTAAFAKLPPIVESVLPSATEPIQPDSEFWLHGPSLKHYDTARVSLSDQESGRSVPLTFEALSYHDYSRFKFSVDWSDGRVGDQGELDLLIVRPASPLEPGKSYRLKVSQLESSYLVAQPEVSSPPSPVGLVAASASSSGGRDFDGDRVLKLELLHTPVGAGIQRIELAGAEESAPFAFALVAEGHSETLAISKRANVKVRLVDSRGIAGPWSQSINVEQPLPLSQVIVPVVSIILLLGFLKSKR